MRSVVKFNEALLGKWRWRLLVESDCFWVKVLCAKYGDEVRTCKRDCFSSGSVWWRDLGKVCEGVSGEGGWFYHGVRRVVGDGRYVRFWEDVWVGDVSLKQKYGRLWSISEQRGLAVAGCGSWEGVVWRWDLTWRRELFEWEKELSLSLLQDIVSPSLQLGKTDGWRWTADSEGVYSVKAAYLVLRQQNRRPTSKFFEMIWETPAPSKVVFHAWRIGLNRLPTMDNLAKRGVLVDSNGFGLCYFCKRELESVTHVFFECYSTYQIWMSCCSWLGISTAMPRDVLGHLQLFESRGWNEHLRRAWRTIWLAVVHAIWTHRNDAAFHGTLITVDAVVDLIKLKSWLWLKHLLKDFVASFFEWENNPSGCIISSGGIGNR